MSSAASRLSIVGEVAIADEPFGTTFEERVHVRRARHPTGGLRRGWRRCSLRPSSSSTIRGLSIGPMCGRVKSATSTPRARGFLDDLLQVRTVLIQRYPRLRCDASATANPSTAASNKVVSQTDSSAAHRLL